MEWNEETIVGSARALGRGSLHGRDRTSHGRLEERRRGQGASAQPRRQTLADPPRPERRAPRQPVPRRAVGPTLPPLATAALTPQPPRAVPVAAPPVRATSPARAASGGSSRRGQVDARLALLLADRGARHAQLPLLRCPGQRRQALLRRARPARLREGPRPSRGSRRLTERRDDLREHAGTASVAPAGRHRRGRRALPRSAPRLRRHGRDDQAAGRRPRADTACRAGHVGALRLSSARRRLRAAGGWAAAALASALAAPAGAPQRDARRVDAAVLAGRAARATGRSGGDELHRPADHLVAGGNLARRTGRRTTLGGRGHRLCGRCCWC